MQPLQAVSWFPGHGSKPTGWDSGCRSPAGWDEADLVRDIAAVAWRECERRRLVTEIVSGGSYRERGQDADAGAGSRLVVQLHADASSEEVGPDVARVFYYPPAPGQVARGLAPAEAIARALRAVLPWPVEVYAAGESWKGPRACLEAVRATSVLVEVGFSDGVRGQVELPQLAPAIGRALGRAV